MPAPEFAATDAEAADRFAKFESVDPFPKIPAALLNSADIADYVAATGMIFPFSYTEQSLKSASYEVSVLGPYAYWDPHDEPYRDELKAGVVLTLPANSIVFVTLEPTFRIPDYLAIRFNLRIGRVYQGLLLGTGPLVDPGFTGRLSIPLHNLTNNDYTIRGGEGLIWLEVTKLSPLQRRERPQTTPDRHGKFFAFDHAKRNLTLDDYLYKAFEGRPIASSIPRGIELAGAAAELAEKQAVKAHSEAEGAKRAAERLRDVGIIASVIALIAVIGAGVGVTLASYSLVNDVKSHVFAISDRLTTAEDTQSVSETQQSQMESRVCHLEAQLGQVDASCPGGNITASPSPSPKP